MISVWQDHLQLFRLKTRFRLVVVVYRITNSMRSRIDRITTDTRAARRRHTASPAVRRLLSPLEIMHRWMFITTKLKHVLRHVQRVARLTLLLSMPVENPLDCNEKAGKKIFKSLCQEVSHSRASEDPGPPLTRVIGDEIVGPFRGVSKHSKRVAVRDPGECSHPAADMIRRGNGRITFWTCKQCNSMWERKPVPSRPTTTYADDDLMMFGKHASETYLEVFTRRPTYVRWVQNTMDEGEAPHPNLIRFAKYCKEMQEVTRHRRPAPTSRAASASAETASDFQAEAEAVLRAMEEDEEMHANLPTSEEEEADFVDQMNAVGGLHTETWLLTPDKTSKHHRHRSPPDQDDDHDL